MSEKPLEKSTADPVHPAGTPAKVDRIMTISQKKIAIENALTPFLSDDLLVRAVRIWEEKYSQQPTFALQRFINEFCDSATLMAQRSQILQSLIRALSGTDGRPRDKPMLPEEAPTPTIKHAEAAAEGCIESFSHLMNGIFFRAPGNMHFKIRLFILENLPGMKLPLLTQRALHAWLSQQYRIPGDIRIDETILRHLINLCYISLCEFIGPIKADRLLHEAILETESQCTFPVRRLL